MMPLLRWRIAEGGCGACISDDPREGGRPHHRGRCSAGVGGREKSLPSTWSANCGVGPHRGPRARARVWRRGPVLEPPWPVAARLCRRTAFCRVTRHPRGPQRGSAALARPCPRLVACSQQATARTGRSGPGSGEGARQPRLHGRRYGVTLGASGPAAPGTRPAPGSRRTAAPGAAP